MRDGRGFSLVVVILLGVAAFAVATTLLVVAESAGTRVAHTVRGEHADALAEAGMERTRSYLQQVTASALDFDPALDPDDEAACAGLPSLPVTAPAGSQVGRPKWSDGVAITYRGKTWTRVAYGEGAYLVRIEDDADDFRTQPLWDPMTGNTLGAGSCREGPLVLGTADNPLRDRNQTVVVTVIGIAPGTDPDRAVHRRTLRRLETFPGLGVVAGIQVDGNIQLSGNASLNACSSVGSVLVDGNISAGGSSNGCACGESRADGISGNWDHCTTTGACPGAVGCLPGTLDTPGPDVPTVLDWKSPAGKDAFFDWSRPCLFSIDSARKILWFWEAGAARGPGNVGCATIQGTPSAYPDPDPADATGYGRCWTPLVLDWDTASPVGVFSGEVTGAAWTPAPGVQTRSFVAIDGLLTARSVPAYVGSFPDAIKPDWPTACTVTYPSQPTRGCTSCDGATPAMSASGGTFWFTGDTLAELRAIPAGVYVWDTSLSLTGAAVRLNGPAPGTAPFATFDITRWPLMTIVVDGNLSLQGRAILGTGQDKAAFPSVILNGNLDFTAAADKFIAGSVWSTGNWDWGGSATNIFFGELHLNGNWTMNGSSAFEWRYLNGLSSSSVFPSPTAPTAMPALE